MSRFLFIVVVTMVVSACGPDASFSQLPIDSTRADLAVTETVATSTAVSKSMAGPDGAPLVPVASEEPDMLTLYRFDSPENAGRWTVINDSVMGGISTSDLALSEAETLLFAGELSLENNGGFASVRSAPGPFGLTDETGIRLTVRGDGKRYHLRLYTPALPRVAYESPFDTVAGEWLTIDLPLQAFEPNIRGRVLTGYGPIAPESITSLGFILKDYQEGDFELEVAAIEAYR